jgi:hypothetical protein
MQVNREKEASCFLFFPFHCSASVLLLQRCHMAEPDNFDSRGKFAVGNKANPFNGLPRKQVLMYRRLEGLTPKAIGRLEKLMEQDENRAVAFNAAKEILDRTLGKVSTKVDVTVKTTAELHLEALVTLSQRAKERRDQVIDAVAVETQLIEPSNCQTGDSVKLLTGENADTPPAPGVGGGALVRGAPAAYTYTPKDDVTPDVTVTTTDDEAEEATAIRDAVAQMFTPPPPGDKEA